MELGWDVELLHGSLGAQPSPRTNMLLETIIENASQAKSEAQGKIGQRMSRFCAWKTNERKSRKKPSSGRGHKTTNILSRATFSYVQHVTCQNSGRLNAGRKNASRLSETSVIETSLDLDLVIVA